MNFAANGSLFRPGTFSETASFPEDFQTMMDLDRCIKLASEEHFCPHCSQRLSCCEAPPFHVGDGLGWGTDIFFVCLNNDCPLFAESWKQFEEMYGHSASCRYMLLPGEKKGEPMMVGGPDAFTGSVIDLEKLKCQNERYDREKAATAKLDTCVAENNLEPVMTLILDDCADLNSRKKAVDLLKEINKLDCLDPIRNHKFYHPEIEQLANLAIIEILKKNHQKECPYCKEIIKAQANICKHCGKEV